MSLVSESADLPRPSAATFDTARLEPSIAGVEDYFALMKPRVMSLVVFTALVGASRSELGRRARSTCGTTPTLML
jgi:heme O synthase-like polyprenyltransferase